MIQYFLSAVAGLRRIAALSGRGKVRLAETVGHVTKVLSMPVAELNDLGRLQDDPGLLVVEHNVSHETLHKARVPKSIAVTNESIVARRLIREYGWRPSTPAGRPVPGERIRTTWLGLSETEMARLGETRHGWGRPPRGRLPPACWSPDLCRIAGSDTRAPVV